MNKRVYDGKNTTHWRCSRCGKRFRSKTGAAEHLALKHKGVGLIRPGEPAVPEMSLAEIAVEASVKRSQGEPLDPLEESLLP